MDITPAKTWARRAALMAALSLLPLALAQAQWTYPGCADVTNADFRFETLAQRGQASDPDMNEPLKMAFDMTDGVVDVYYVERKGKLKVWSGASKTSKVLGQFQVEGATGTSEEGLLGVVLDPGFQRNKWIYLFWTPANPVEYRLSRFTLAGERLDMATEKVLLRFPHETRACCHNGGGMQFDAYGDLWITTGGNGSNQGGPLDEVNVHYSEEDGSSNTADLRGGVLRIHPDDSPRGYGIPKGNFGEYFADRAQSSGQAALAAQYRDTALVKPEIYIKGGRNPYTMTLDPVRRWITTGDVGPDNGAQMEEHNLYKAPAFSGWPYFAGKNLMHRGNKDPNAPTNTSKWNKGLKTLPPATPAIRSYGTATAVTGPIYRYDGDLQSAVKFPPHFHRKWFIAEFKQNWIRVATLDEAGTRIEKEDVIFQNHRFTNPLDMQMGPDGALYVLNYAGYFNSTAATSIVKVSYAGTCRPALPKLEMANTSAVARLAGPTGSALEAGVVLLGLDRALRLAPGRAHRNLRFELVDLNGRLNYAGRVPSGAASVRVPESAGSGLFRLRILDSEGRLP